MNRIKCDLLVVGAGSGGLSVASGAAQMGADVVLVEKGRMGGDCLNYGCVPSKALIAVARAAHEAREAGRFGVSTGAVAVDYAAAMDHVQAAIATIAPHDSQERFEGFGIRVIREEARFTGPREMQAGDTVISARRIVLATGASPAVPPIPGLADVPYLTNETLFDQREKPEHLIVLGGGPIGIEMAQAHRRLGCAVTVIEAETALGHDDPELAAELKEIVRGEGVDLVEGARAEAVAPSAEGITVTTDDGRRITGTHLLVALGRRANTAALNLDAAGIETTKTGIQVDSSLRTTNRKVFAIGDVAGGMQFTHVAGYHGGIVVRRAVLGLPATAKTSHIPRVTYADPELAQIGLTEAEARGEYGGQMSVVQAPLASNDRAVAMDRRAGRIKVMVVGGKPVGVSILAAEAGELIAPWSLAISKGLKLSDISGMVLPYPTMSEVGKSAASAYFSPKLFDNAWIKRAVRLVQRLVP
ncbi:dihydrolipoyl dehydrogenase family protein [Pseudooceanicola aestuarii]|uniref:dihydrolipoyl dehydrogenase family protein n=1 Tax=Pseudooceanicola aestuarii TaxID=2697319 RepID=UPI0013D28B30|nr:FAD-dependent oxidoreductase [Pseudooceanicola aestuarii]